MSHQSYDEIRRSVEQSSSSDDSIEEIEDIENEDKVPDDLPPEIQGLEGLFEIDSITWKPLLGQFGMKKDGSALMATDRKNNPHSQLIYMGMSLGLLEEEDVDQRLPEPNSLNFPDISRDEWGDPASLPEELKRDIAKVIDVFEIERQRDSYGPREFLDDEGYFLVDEEELHVEIGGEVYSYEIGDEDDVIELECLAYLADPERFKHEGLSGPLPDDKYLIALENIKDYGLLVKTEEGITGDNYELRSEPKNGAIDRIAEILEEK